MKSLIDFTPNFTKKELECPCCGAYQIKDKALWNLQAFRNRLCNMFHRDIRLIVNSGYRCEKHNKEVGGVPNSQHLVGNAIDIYSPDIHVGILYNEAINSGLFTTIILYEKSHFIHVDVRKRDRIKYWRWEK